MTKLLSPIENLRVDRAFSYNILEFEKYTEDKQLLKDLIVYMCLRKQKDLFGFTDLNLDDFCIVMNWNKSKLRRTHESPIFYKIFDKKTKEEHLLLEKKHGEYSEYRVWDRTIENALLILQNHKFYFTEEFKREELIDVSLKNFVYLKEVSVNKKKVGKTWKILYRYKITEDFEKLRDKYFVTTNVEHYKKLKSKGLTSLYLNLMYKINYFSTQGKNIIYYSIVDLGALMNISTERLGDKRGFSDIKNKILKKWNSHFVEIVSEDIKGLNLSFQKGDNSRTNNIPTISWGVQTKEYLKKKETEIYEDIFYTNLFQKLSTNYQYNYCSFETGYNKLISGFLSWLFSSEDIKVKGSIYLTVFSEVKGNKYTTKAVEDRSKVYFTHLSIIGGYNQKKKFLRYENEKYYFKNPNLGIEHEYQDLRIFVNDVEKNYDNIVSNFK